MKTKMKILLIVIIALILIIIPLIFINGTLTGGVVKETSEVKIGYLPVIQGLPLYLAIDKGYFKEEGIEVEAIKFDSPNQIVDALMQGNLDFGSTSTALGITGIADYKNPGKLKIYAVSGGTEKVPNENLMIPLDSDIRSFKELKGKKLGILIGTVQWRTITREILAQNGLDMDKDVTIVELATGIQMQALTSKQVDALIALEPIPTIIKEKNLGKELVHGPAEKDIADPLYAGAGVVSVKFAQENPETTKKIIRVMERAINEINSNPEEAREYLKQYTPLDENLIKKAPISIFKMTSQLTPTDKEAIQKFYDLFTRYRVVEGKIDFNKLIF